MFKAISDWWNSSDEVVDTKNIPQPYVNFKGGIWDYVVEKFNGRTDENLILVLTHTEPDGEVHEAYIRIVNSRRRYILGVNASTKQLEYCDMNTLTSLHARCTTAHLKEFTATSECLQRVEKELLALRSPPGTYPHWRSGQYFKEIVGDEAVFVNENGESEKVDLYLLSVVSWHHPIIQTTHPKYYVHDYLTVDRRVVKPECWGRWVKFNEVKGEGSDWVIRAVPDGVYVGPLRYFGVTIDFDGVELAGMCFNPLTMLRDAFEYLQKRLTLEMGTSVRLSLNTNKIMVKHGEVECSLNGYMKSQRTRPIFVDNNPYLNPKSVPVKSYDHYYKFNEEGDFVYVPVG